MKASLPDRPYEVAGDRPATGPASTPRDPRPSGVGPSAAPGQRRRVTPALRAYCLVAFAVLLEIVLILPFADHLADTNPTIHFTQHGFIFLGGVLIGIATREIYGTSRS